MAKNLAKNVSSKNVPQSEPLIGTNQKKNNAGGYSFEITPMQRLERFLILGSDTGTYYVGEKELTKQNTSVITDLLRTDGKAVVDLIVAISDEGRAPKNAPAIFALAVAVRFGDLETKQYALKNLSKVARTATDLFSFIQQYKTELGGGFGNSVKRAIQNWYQSMNIGKAAYQIVKYRQRDGWSHHDVLHLAHPKARDEAENNLFRFAKSLAEDKKVEVNFDLLPEVARGFLLAQSEKDVKKVVKLIGDFKLPREAIPTEFLNSPEIWNALLQDMPATALIRNLGKMTSVGLIKPLSDAEKLIAKKLDDSTWLQKSRIHPIAVLAAMKVYSAGHGVKGSLSWNASRKVLDSLDGAFYGTFKNVEPTGKNFLMGVDISGSMFGSPVVGMDFMNAAEVAAVMALVTVAREENVEIMGFTTQFEKLNISPKMRLDTVLAEMRKVSSRMGGTDCAQPMVWAQKNKLKVDVFSVYTDNETWAGSIHPSQALKQYRKAMGINSKLIVAATSATLFTIADPKDAGMLDIVGFDSAAPQLISNLARM